MLHFLQTPGELKKIIPDAAAIREKIAEKEMKVDVYFDRFIGSLAEYTPRGFPNVCSSRGRSSSASR
mgnify:CR=1 FL=1